MQIGKLTNHQLNEKIFEHIGNERSDILIGAGIGEDCAAIDFGEEVCVLSTDPITGASNELGRLAVHISCNDIASSGAETAGLLMTILVPVGTPVEDIEQIMKDANEEANKLGATIIGGHTEWTTAVTRIVVSTTAIGKVKKTQLVETKGAQVGDRIIVTKYPGLEGAGIIAYERHDELKNVLSDEEMIEAKAYLRQISVVPEGIFAGSIGVTSMHDVTEGGLLGALWEVCEAAKLGCEISRDKIHVPTVIEKICNHYDLNPLRLISSGMMMITVNEENFEILCKGFEEKGIFYSDIGQITDGNDYVMIDNNQRLTISPPESDELYKVVD